MNQQHIHPCLFACPLIILMCRLLRPPCNTGYAIRVCGVGISTNPGVALCTHLFVGTCPYLRIYTSVCTYTGGQSCAGTCIPTQNACVTLH